MNEKYNEFWKRFDKFNNIEFHEIFHPSLPVGCKVLKNFILQTYNIEIIYVNKNYEIEGEFLTYKFAN